MKKLLTFLSLLSFQLGYLSWGKGQTLFIFQGEAEIIRKGIANPMSVLHPFILVPFLGQLLLIITLFQKEPSKTLTFIGLGCLSMLMLMLLFIGVSVPDGKIFISALPFFVVAVLILRTYKKEVI
jgi:hypothetical protein